MRTRDNVDLETAQPEIAQHGGAEIGDEDIASLASARRSVSARAHLEVAVENLSFVQVCHSECRLVYKCEAICIRAGFILEIVQKSPFFTVIRGGP